MLEMCPAYKRLTTTPLADSGFNDRLVKLRPFVIVFNMTTFIAMIEANRFQICPMFHFLCGSRYNKCSHQRRARDG